LDNNMKHYSRRFFLCMSLAALASGTQTARAEVTSVTAKFRAPFGVFNGITYEYVEAMVDGTVTSSQGVSTTYSVPSVLIYPRSGGNGYGWVDLPNNTIMTIYPSSMAGDATVSHASPCETRGDFKCENPDSVPLSDNKRKDLIVQSSRRFTEDFLFEEGFTYISIQYHKAATAHFGPTPPEGERPRLVHGSIDRASDGFVIALDAAQVLRDPSKFNPGGLDVPAPAPVTKVLATGYSQSSFLMNSILVRGLNADANGNPIFDGILLNGGGVLCMDIPELHPTYWSLAFCGSGPPNAVRNEKVISINWQGDIQFQSAQFFRREFTVDPMDPDCMMGPPAFNPNCSPNPNYRQYEFTGIGHIPGPMNNTEWMGCRQNPADPRQFARAAVRHLYNWVREGTEPPPPVNTEGAIDFMTGAFTPVVDADGNWVGGIRPPHMPSTIDGMPAGAPLGRYDGINPAYLLAPMIPPMPHIWCLLSGTFDPFTDADVQSRYPTKEEYVARVTRAADDLLAKGYILQADRDQYIADAEAEAPVLPAPRPDPKFTRPTSTGGGCSATALGGGFPVGMGLLALGWILLKRRTRS
jgi:uncharacterized protein (TIGR03382 family)